MPQEKNLVPGSAQMLLLRLLAERDMYGYQMIEELAKRSNDTFALKAGTLYPILHTLEAEGSIESYEQPGGLITAGKPRRYYRITKAGRGVLEARQTEWRRVSRAINAVLDACRTGGEAGNAVPDGRHIASAAGGTVSDTRRTGCETNRAALDICRTGIGTDNAMLNIFRTGCKALRATPSTRLPSHQTLKEVP